MNESETGQVNKSAAEVYEEFFLPALFAEWPPRLIGQAAIQPGQRVLDVACGTGVLTRAVAEEVGPLGSATGLDINEGMLAVARRNAPDIEWRQGPAEALPFNSDSFDAVVCQFALMFFEDKQAALKEMMRVLRPDGHLAIAVWDSLENTPGYLAMTELLGRLIGEEAAYALQAPYVLGKKEALTALLEDAGIAHAAINTFEGTACFPSISSWVYTDIKGWTLADMIDDAQYEQLLAEAQKEFQPYVNSLGQVSFSAPAHIVTAVQQNHR